MLRFARRPLTAIAMSGALLAAAPPLWAEGEITSPERFFGHRLGADRQLARWDRIVEYFQRLDLESDRVRVVDMGPSTEGHPFLLVILTSPENMAKLERLREVSRKLADPRSIEEGEIRELVQEGRAVVSQSFGLHSTEVAGTQTAPELAYDLVARDDEENRRILDEVITLLIPCLNPDGQLMVTDWYRRYVGTEYEAVRLPWLYQKYVGHDNNRDGDYLNMVESAYTAEILYRDWKPQAYVDHHQMGSYGVRMVVPPYSEPIRPHADPLIWREISWYGAHIAYKLEEQGRAGILNSAQYPGWGHFGWHWITPFHNIAGMLTESASASLATPLFLHPEQLRGGVRQFPEYEAQSTMPSPWPGGWWRVRDIVEQQKIAARSILDLAARHRRTVLWNAYLKARRQIERGAAGSPKAYVIPASQHDRLTAIKMINTLISSDVEIQRATAGFSVDGVSYDAGSFVVSLAQPKAGLVRNLLGRTSYPDNVWTRDREGAPLRPYDLSTHTMAEFMGVRVDPVDAAVEGGLETLSVAVPPSGRVAPGGPPYALDGRLNASYRAVNLLLDENERGLSIRRVDRAGAGLRPGDFLVAGVSSESVGQIASETGVDFAALDADPGDAAHDLRRMRVAMYQRYRGGSMDEGWTRFLLERFAFPFATVRDAEIKGDLGARYDVLILPHDASATLMGEVDPRPDRPPEVYPPEYRSGFGEEEVEAIAAFVQQGGTLVALGGATDFAIEKLELRVRNAVDGLSSTEFFCPGSTLRASFDAGHPLAYGMPSEGLALYWQGAAFEVTPSRHNHHYETIVRYADRDLLRSGWLIGEEHLAKKAAMVSARHGEGRVILIGFRAQHRAQTHGTFKLLFNALLR